MEILLLLIHIIEYLIFAYLVLATAYIFIYATAGLFYHQKKGNLPVSKIRKFAVLIPGYKEDAVIVNVAKQALKQDYPADQFEVIVIADHFSKETLEQLYQLPIRVVEVVFEVSKKSKALNKCMEVIGDDYDVAFILDADNIMEPDVLSKINAAFDQGFMAVQGHRTALNLNASFAILDGMSEEINNHIFRKGHRVLGMSSALIGSGMGLDYHLFKSTMATVDSVGEDKEVELKIIRNGIKIDYVADAIIYDEKTQKSDVFVNQRRRWIAAQLDYFKSHFFDGLNQLITKGNIDYFDKVLQMIQPPRILLTGILFIIVVFMAIIHWMTTARVSRFFVPDFTVWSMLLAFTVLALLFSIPKKFYNKPTFRALLRIPQGFILMIISLLKIKGASKKFLHTTHGPADSPPTPKKGL
ncbi:MAG: glycosyltransferase family 2 protein [Bacteroidales bacterium]|nr:glycosyltransferase family 2 protein [Bacteroidales bacterium]